MKRSDAAIGKVYYIRDYSHFDIVLTNNISLGFNRDDNDCDITYRDNHRRWHGIYRGWNRLY